MCISLEWDRGPYRTEGCPLLPLRWHSLMLTAITFLQRWLWTVTVKLLIIGLSVKLWTNNSTENFSVIWMNIGQKLLFCSCTWYKEVEQLWERGSQPSSWRCQKQRSNEFIHLCTPIVAGAENCLLCVLNQQSLFSFSCWLVSFQSIYNGEHIYKIKGGKFRACSSYRKWLHSGAMSLSQLYAAFISRESDSLPWCTTERKQAPLIWWQSADQSTSYLKTA